MDLYPVHPCPLRANGTIAKIVDNAQHFLMCQRTRREIGALHTRAVHGIMPRRGVRLHCRRCDRLLAIEREFVTEPPYMHDLAEQMAALSMDSIGDFTP